MGVASTKGGVMSVLAHKPARPPAHARPQLRLLEPRQAARLHLLTYTVGSAFFWLLWGAISVAADTWYWWATVSVGGWTLVLGLHLWYALR